MSAGLPRSLLVPVETLNREFDAKLLLALLAAERGWQPIIGGRTAMHDRLRSLPRSIYLAKGIRTGNRAILSILDRLGHVIVALDEEALLRFSDEALLMMFDDETFNRPRLLYAWGRSNAQAWRRFGGYRGTPILEVGNPRVDLLSPRYRGYYDADVARLRERYGRFALFSSNFAIVNHYIPDHVRFRVAAGTSAERADELKGGIFGHKRAIFEHFKRMIPQLGAALQPHSLVVRPHPSENHDLWRELCGGLDNVHIVHEGPIAPWLMAASALVHNGCTSAVEAAVLGTPAFSYRPVLSEEFDLELPNALSVECSDLEPLLEQVLAAVGDPDAKVELTPERHELLAANIACLDGRCCEQILDSFETQRAALEAAPWPTPWGRIAGTLHHLARGAARTVRTRRPGKSNRGYLAHKFPGIGATEVDARIARFRALAPGLPAVRARELSRDIFAIEPT